MNETKTDFTNVLLADVTEADDELETLRGQGPWRKKKVLGSFLCSTEDIKSLRILGQQSGLQVVLEDMESTVQDTLANEAPSLQCHMCLHDALQLQQLGCPQVTTRQARCLP